MKESEPYSSQDLVVLCINSGSLISLSSIGRFDGLLNFINEYEDVILSTCRRNGGHVIQYPGSQTFCVWLSDGNENIACECLMELVNQLDSKNNKARQFGYPQQVFGFGLVSGECIVRKERGRYIDVMGEVVNKSVKFEQLAQKENVVAVADKVVLKTSFREKFEAGGADLFRLRRVYV